MQYLDCQVHNWGKRGKASVQACVQRPEFTAAQLRQCYVVRIVGGSNICLPGEQGRDPSYLFFHEKGETFS